MKNKGLFLFAHAFIPVSEKISRWGYSVIILGLDPHVDISIYLCEYME